MILQAIKKQAIDGTIEVLKDALIRFAEEGVNDVKLRPEQVQIWIGTEDPESCTPYMWLVKNGKPFMQERVNNEVEGGKEMSPIIIWEQILNVLNDLSSTGLKATVFITNLIETLKNELATDARNIEIMITTMPGTNNVFPVPFLYDRGIEGDDHFVKALDWEKDVFTDEGTQKLMVLMGLAAEEQVSEGADSKTE